MARNEKEHEKVNFVKKVISLQVKKRDITRDTRTRKKIICFKIK